MAQVRLQRRSPVVELLTAFLACALVVWILASFSFATRISLIGNIPHSVSSNSGPETKTNQSAPAVSLSLLNVPPAKGLWSYTNDVYDAPTKHPNATVVSWEFPRVVLIRQFLSPDEIHLLLNTADDGYQRSEVVSDTASTSSGRTSYGAWLNGPRKTPFVMEIQERIAKTLSIPTDFGESIYVLRYDLGQKYEAHADNCRQAGSELTASCQSFLRRAGGPECGASAGGVTCGDRIATAIMYLQAPARGGATVFPYAKIKSLSVARRRAQDTGLGEELDADSPMGALEDASRGVNGSSLAWYCNEDNDVLRVYPEAGDAIMFFNYIPGETPESPAEADTTAVHAGCPPIEGTKVIATRWIRSAPFA